MSSKFEVLIKPFNHDIKHGFIWSLNLMTPLGGGVKTGEE